MHPCTSPGRSRLQMSSGAAPDSPEGAMSQRPRPRARGRLPSCLPARITTCPPAALPPGWATAQLARRAGGRRAQTTAAPRHAQGGGACRRHNDGAAVFFNQAAGAADFLSAWLSPIELSRGCGTSANCLFSFPPCSFALCCGAPSSAEPRSFSSGPATRGLGWRGPCCRDDLLRCRGRTCFHSSAG